MVGRAVDHARGTLILKALALTPDDENEVFDFFRRLAWKLRLAPEIIRPGIIYRIARLRRDLPQNWRQIAEAELRELARKPPIITPASSVAVVAPTTTASEQQQEMPTSATGSGETPITLAAKQGRGRRPKYNDDRDRPMTVSTQIDKALIGEIDALARAEDRSRSKVISMLLSEALDARKLEQKSA